MTDRSGSMRHITVRGVVVLDGKLLCTKLKPYKGSMAAGAGSLVADGIVDQPKSAGYWCIPGGHLDPNESLVDGCRREMLEETGVAAQVGNLLYIQQFSHKGIEYIEFFYEITNAADYQDIDLSKSSHGLEEIEEIAFIEPGKEEVLPKFFSTVPLVGDITSYKGPQHFLYP